MDQELSTHDDLISRRNFIKSSASAAVTAGSLGMANFVFAAAPEKIKVGVIGCGGRGTEAAQNCVKASPIVEQHVHNIDIMQWLIGANPIKCLGIGGRQTRQEKGNIWDHFSIEFEYPNDIRVASYCAHFDGIKGRVTEQVEGTKGKSNCSTKIWGAKEWTFQGDNPNPYVLEHVNLIAAITGNAPYINEGKQVADSTLCAIMGRMAAYAGREVTWKWITEESKLDLMPPALEFTSFQPHPIAMPGQTQLV